MRKYQRRVFRLAFGMLKNQEDAMDVAQEAFVRAHQNLDRFQGTASFYTWVYRIASNLCIDQLRKRRGEAVEYDDALRREDAAADTVGLKTASKDFNPGRRSLDRELGQRLQDALETLSDNHREILLLRELEGLSYEELAQTLDIKKGTVMSRLYHARQNMQAVLKDYLTEAEYAELTGDK